MYLVLVIQLFSIPFVQVSAGPSKGDYNLRTIEDCKRKVVSNAGRMFAVEDSKYFIYLFHKDGSANSGWNVESANGNYIHYRNICDRYGLSMPDIRHPLDWKSLEAMATDFYLNKDIFAAFLNRSDEWRYRDEYLASHPVQLFIMGMYLNNNPSKGRVGATSDHDATIPQYIVWAGEQPPDTNYDVVLGLAPSRGSDGVDTYRLAASYKKRLVSGDTSGLSHGIYPRICTYPPRSSCYGLTNEELQKNNETLLQDYVFYLTDAFRGEWYMTSFMKNRQEGQAACKTVDAELLEESIYSLPWSKGKTFRWDLNRIFKKYDDAVRNKLKVAPHVGFHGKVENNENYEYYFEFNRTQLRAESRTYFSNYGFRPQLMERKMLTPGERFCLCYKPRECFNNVGRRRRDLRSGRRRRVACAKRG